MTMADVQPATPDTSQLPADLSVHEAADLLAKYRTEPQKLGESAAENAESVIEEIPDQEQPEEIEAVDPDSSEEGSDEEITEDAEDDLESLAEGEEDQPEDLEAEPEFYEIEGEEVSLDTIKEWRESGMRQDEFTRKTQVLAQQTQSITEMEKNLNQFAHASAQQHKGRLSKIEGALKQYQSVDWARLASDDNQKFTVHKEQFEQLKRQYASEQREFAGFAKGFDTLSKQVTAKKAEAAYPEIKQRIKGWNEGRYHELREFLTGKLGANVNQVNNITDPWFWELANAGVTYLSGKKLNTGKRKIRRPTKTLKAKAPVAKADPKGTADKAGLEAISKSMGSARDQMDAGAALLKQRRGKSKR